MLGCCVLRLCLLSMPNNVITDKSKDQNISTGRSAKLDDFVRACLRSDSMQRERVSQLWERCFDSGAVDNLIVRGPRPTGLSAQEPTPLMDAIISHSMTEFFQRLEWINVTLTDGTTALMYALENKEYDFLPYLIQLRPKARADGKTVDQLAIELGDEAVDALRRAE